MRFMVIVKANKDSEAGILPSTEILTAMGKFNEELVKAGVMLAGEGLHPSSKGVRGGVSGDKRAVTDGAFTETKEAGAGDRLWEGRSVGQGGRGGEGRADPDPRGGGARVRPRLG